MGRLARVVVTDVPHHVTQRGNNRQGIFLADEDYAHYLGLLRDYSRRHGLEFWAYCLLPNHVHLVAVPTGKQSLAKALSGAHMRYAQYFHTRTEGSGHLWQGRFFSCPLDEPHLWAAVRYVELNPVRARLVEKVADWRWSSAWGRLRQQTDPLLSPAWPPTEMQAKWAVLLGEQADEQRWESLRRCTRTGRPCGEEGFAAGLEAMLARVLRPGQRGRRRK